METKKFNDGAQNKVMGIPYFPGYVTMIYTRS
jgi:hypothetical protein